MSKGDFLEEILDKVDAIHNEILFKGVHKVSEIEEFEYKCTYKDLSKSGGPFSDMSQDVWFTITKKSDRMATKHDEEYVFTGNLAKRLYVTMLRDTHRGFCKVVNEEIAKGNG